jgi:uncharacterized protein YigE (DUF2233 family)
MLRKTVRFLVSPSLGLLTLLLAGLPLSETPGATETFEGVLYHSLTIHPSKTTLSLFWQDPEGKPYRSFRALDAALATRGERLFFAMNAGIFLPGWIPEGLHIEDGHQRVSLNLNGPPPRQPGQFTPNFYLQPNGVFYLLPDHLPGILSTNAFAAAALRPRLAVQSGPLLLAAAKIHPVFDPASTSRLIRNGVGVDPKGQVHLIATDRSDRGRVNFHTFARLFLARGCRDALYLDGDISEFYLRTDHDTIPSTTDFAAILAITEQRPK